MDKVISTGARKSRLRNSKQKEHEFKQCMQFKQRIHRTA